MARESFLLRTDPQVLDALRRWADDELRSANAQLDFVLREALRKSGRLPKDDSGRHPQSGTVDDGSDQEPSEKQ